MLVLGRRPNQTIIIETASGTVTVKVTKLERQQVKLGIDAPQSVKVLRGELKDKSEAS